MLNGLKLTGRIERTDTKDIVVKTMESAIEEKLEDDCISLMKLFVAELKLNGDTKEKRLDILEYYKLQMRGKYANVFKKILSYIQSVEKFENVRYKEKDKPTPLLMEAKLDEFLKFFGVTDEIVHNKIRGSRYSEINELRKLETPFKGVPENANRSFDVFLGKILERKAEVFENMKKLQTQLDGDKQQLADEQYGGRAM